MDYNKLLNGLVISNFFSGSQWHPEHLEDEAAEIFLAS